MKCLFISTTSLEHLSQRHWFYAIRMDNSYSASYHTEVAKGQAQEKGSQLMDKASNAAQSAKESAQNAGQQMQAKAQGAVDAVKDAVNSNK
ncbi:stress-induced protein KIN2-like isoform X2 [Salvia hispanica]|uniref:stress-induced protein KIN2-like isoform X2 n=1 Tax=Salvia hispanica TaxID=49212 RepID=UPI0020097F0A|nr:stress-induced protein KIN2-like isoform X2 [Salvia hispanica]